MLNIALKLIGCGREVHKNYEKSDNIQIGNKYVRTLSNIF